MVRNYRDIQSIEQAPLPNGDIPCTYALLERSAGESPQAPALSFFLRVEDHADPVRWSYAELLADVTRAANLFRQLGVERGDVVAMVMPNLPETHIANWGAQTAGIAFAVNNQLEGAQMGELLRAAKARWLVTVGPESDPRIWQRVQQAVAELPDLQGLLLVDMHRHRPDAPPRAPLPQLPGGLQVLDFNSVLAGAPGDALQFPQPCAEDIAAYFCTGGTTGLPKIALHSQRNEVTFCAQIDAALGEPVLRSGRTVLTALPLFHIFALIATGLAVFSRGGHVLLATPEGFRTPGLIARFWEIVETHQVSSYCAVPTVYAGLLQVPTEGRNLQSLTVALSGAAPLPVELLRRFEQQSGQRIIEGYGLTEGTCASAVNPVDGQSRVGSIGLRLPWQDMRPMIVDAQGNWLREAVIDEIGAICLSGSNVFAGYLDPAQGKGSWFETPDGKRWFNTGDLGRCDADGYFWLTGRKKELIIRGGHNIDPRSIEEALVAHPAVAMCAAVGRPDSYAGELPVAYVQLHPGSQVEAGELLEHASRHIVERAAVPKEVIVLDALPLTGVGKIFKPALNMREIEQVVRREAAALDIELLAVQVEQESRRGMLASYRCSGDSARLAQALASYTFASEAR